MAGACCACICGREHVALCWRAAVVARCGCNAGRPQRLPRPCVHREAVPNTDDHRLRSYMPRSCIHGALVHGVTHWREPCGPLSLGDDASGAGGAGTHCTRLGGNSSSCVACTGLRAAVRKTPWTCVFFAERAKVRRKTSCGLNWVTSWHRWSDLAPQRQPVGSCVCAQAAGSSLARPRLCRLCL